MAKKREPEEIVTPPPHLVEYGFTLANSWVGRVEGSVAAANEEEARATISRWVTDGLTLTPK